jgi:hypothetical protein
LRVFLTQITFPNGNGGRGPSEFWPLLLSLHPAELFVIVVKGIQNVLGAHRRADFAAAWPRSSKSLSRAESLSFSAQVRK